LFTVHMFTVISELQEAQQSLSERMSA